MKTFYTILGTLAVLAIIGSYYFPKPQEATYGGAINGWISPTVFQATTMSSTNMYAWIQHGMFANTSTFAVNSTTGALAIPHNTDIYKYKMTHDPTGVSVSSSRIYVDEPGLYFISFSAVGKSTAPNKILDIWLSVNGVNVEDSNTRSTFVGAGNERVITVTFFQRFTAGQYFELYAWSDDTGTTLQAGAAGTNPTRPISPSIITTVNWLSN